MSDKNIKANRGQVRQITKELLTSEMMQTLLKEVSSIVNRRLDEIDKYVKGQLSQLNDKAEETQSYVVRNLALAKVKAAETKVDPGLRVGVDDGANTPAT